MYGLVNRALHELVINNYGIESWNNIKKKAGVNIEEFINMNQYDDAVTYSLVGAASEILNLPARDLLFSFGKHWINYTANKGYGAYMQIAGTNFIDFLKNLDNLHTRVGLIYEDLEPPSFQCNAINDTEMLLEYHTHREALSPLVEGLIFGLAEKFKIQVSVKHIEKRADKGFDVFQINIL